MLFVRNGIDAAKTLNLFNLHTFTLFAMCECFTNNSIYYIKMFTLTTIHVLDTLRNCSPVSCSVSNNSIFLQ